MIKKPAKVRRYVLNTYQRSAGIIYEHPKAMLMLNSNSPTAEITFDQAGYILGASMSYAFTLFDVGAGNNYAMLAAYLIKTNSSIINAATPTNPPYVNVVGNQDILLSAVSPNLRNVASSGFSDPIPNLKTSGEVAFGFNEHEAVHVAARDRVGLYCSGLFESFPSNLSLISLVAKIFWIEAGEYAARVP